MSRMIEALKRIEEQSPPLPDHADEAVEAALAQAEAAAEAAADELDADDFDSDGGSADEVEAEDFAVHEGSADELTAEGPGDETIAEAALTEELATGGICVEELALAEAPAVESTPADLPAPRPAWSLLQSESCRQAFDKLAEKVLAELPPSSPASLMITSPLDGDGKTQTLVSLAGALAERAGEDVLLLDADMRKADLAARLGVEASVGLADVLSGVAGWPDVVRRTMLPRLNVLPGTTLFPPSGRAPVMVNLESLLAELAEHYRLVLVDTSSLVHRQVAPMAHYCSGVYMVVRLGYTPRRAAREAAMAIEACGGRLLGTVVLGC